jgi:hypothetical protein
MISREIMVGGAVLAGLLVGGVAYAATSTTKAAAAAAGGATLKFTALHRYEIDMVVPARSTWTTSSAPTLQQVQTNLNTLASGAFTVVSVGASLTTSTAPDGGFTFWVIVDCLTTTTLNQSDLLAGSPTGTTITATDEGLTSQQSSSSSSTTTSSSSSTSTSSSTTSSSSSSSSSSGSTSSGTPAPTATTVIGVPFELASPGPPATTGWRTTITLGPDSVSVTAWPGDSVVIKLPSGATWASSGSTAGFPTSGSADFTGAYSAPVVVTLAWTLGSNSYSTTLTFTSGRSWGSTSAFLIKYDTVRISLSTSDYTSMLQAFTASTAESAAIATVFQRLQTAGINLNTMTYAEALRSILLAGGPLDTPLAINLATLKVWVVANAISGTRPASAAPVDGTPLPSDWPNDSGAIVRAEFQYTGSGLTLAALAFPLSAWVRLT